MSAPSRSPSEFCREMLPAVSRTFALSIRLLPGQLGDAVREAYLLCRIADTVEDAPDLSPEDKARLLAALAASFDDSAARQSFADGARAITGERAHVRLAHHADLVFAAFGELPAGTQSHVRRWVREMIGGMRTFVLRYPDGIRIQSLDEYKEYCYYVAGTVGYLLTDLWYEHASSIGTAQHRVLRERCRAFAEALQTVNILKDVVRDAEQENSIYVPEELLRAHGSAQASILSRECATQTHAALGALVRLAWQDLDQATAYLLAIPRRAVSIRLFCALPLLFAYATLRDLTRKPGALVQRELVKISRAEVNAITVASVVSVLSNHALARLVERIRARPLRLWARAA